MTTSEKRSPTDSSHDVGDGPPAVEAHPLSEPSPAEACVGGECPDKEEATSRSPRFVDGRNVSDSSVRGAEHGKFTVRSLPEALAALNIAVDHLAAAYGMVARRKRSPAVLDALDVAEAAVDAVRYRLHIFTALAAHTEPGDTAYAAAVLRFYMTGQFPEESGDTAEGGESCS